MDTRWVRLIRRAATATVALGLLFMVAWQMGGPAVHAEDPAPLSSAYYEHVSQRFGVGLNRGTHVAVNGGTRSAEITDYAVDALHMGWYSDWRINAAPLRPFGVRYAQLVLVRPVVYPTITLQLTATVLANPGSLWLVGNEPEAKYGQGKRSPEEYAQIYHHVQGIIKGLDPTAIVAIGGVIQPTPVRLQWLDMVLDEYRTRYGVEMPVDVWNIHVQILQEVAGTPADPFPWGAEIPVGITAPYGRRYGINDNCSSDIFKQLVVEMRQWMKSRGLQDKPLIISEYGVLMPSGYIGDGDEALGDQRVKDFMRQSFDFLLSSRDESLGYPADGYRLVQQWLWYSLNDQPYDPATGDGYNGSLFSHLDPTRLTQFGVFFRDYMNVLLGSKVMLPFVTR